jgi:prepilin-type N-terminal cleavage/methylation domain-containing protein
MRKQTGFTLIEIAIVLVIVGLLLGGVLKGQELITSARVRNIASQLDGVKIAYLGFQDRYRSLPGDYSSALAGANIPGPTITLGCTGANCQNGRIDAGSGLGLNETILAWHQLGRSGFINGSYDGVGDAIAATPQNSPTNPFSGYLQLANDLSYYDVAIAATPVVLNIKTGGNVPAALIAELDRKIDDGLPQTGSFRSASGGSTVVPATPDAPSSSCVTAATPPTYDGTNNPKTCAGVAIQ